MKILKTAAAILLIATPLFAAGPFDLDKFLTGMENSEKTLNTVSFDYTQEIAYSLTNEKQSASGRAVFMKPDKVFMKQEKPTTQTIITNGSKVWVYTPEYNQVIQDDWKKWTKNSLVPDSLVNMGQNWKELRKKYNFTYIADDGSSRVIDLTVKDKEKGGWTIRFWIDGASFVVNKMILTGENVSITTVAQNYMINPQVDKSMFDFKPPKGVEIMKMP